MEESLIKLVAKIVLIVDKNGQIKEFRLPSQIFTTNNPDTAPIQKEFKLDEETWPVVLEAITNKLFELKTIDKAKEILEDARKDYNSSGGT